MAVPELSGELRTRDLAENESVALFVGRAREALPGFELTDANAGTVARLCVALEGIPLALELAAARIRVLSPEAMLDRIEQRFQLLSRGYVDVPDRQRSMEASVEWSHDLCSPQEQALWARLSVFSGGFDLDAAEIVCADDALPAADVLDALSSLVDKSLLSRDPLDEATHFFMLETIRSYGAMRLDLTGATELWENRHRDYFAQRAGELRQQWVGPDQPRLVAGMRRNHANLQSVLERTTGSKEQAAVALRIAVDLEGYWAVTGLLTEARRWLEAALAHGVGTAPERAVALSISGYLAELQVKLNEAGHRIAAARAELECSTGAPHTVAWARLHFAEAVQALYRGDLTAAERSCRRSIELFESAGDVHGLPAAYVVLGVCLSAGGREGEAAAAHARCLAITEARGELHIRGLALWALSVDARRSGDLARAAGLARLSVDLRSQLGDDAGVALALESLASISAAQGDAVRSATLLGAAAQLWERVGLGPLAGKYLAEQRDLGERGARQQLDLLSFESAHQRGLSMPAEQAVDYALGRSQAIESVELVDLDDTPLTARERQVAALIGDGLSNRQIATRLVISVRTAQGHVENILRKLGFSSRTQVAAWVVSRSTGSRR
jgi:non-specific serine/threonine protein kinase